MNKNSVANLAAQLRGRLILPDDPSYNEARAVYNAMHDRHPLIVVQAHDVADVVATVNFARDHGHLLAVRGGSHSVPGFSTCDDGVVLDLGAMNSVYVDDEARTVRAEGGCTLGDLDHATHVHGLAVPGGTVSTTGLAGLTLGGGMGHLSRGFGLSCDNLISAQVVTAAGDVVTCDAGRYNDLFWAIRGGGGNFGVVTSFEFRAYPLESVFGGPTFFHLDGEVLRNYEKLICNAPEALNAILGFVQAPPVPFVPEECHHKPVLVILSCWSGEAQEEQRIGDAVSACGEVIGQALWRMPYPEMNMFFDELLPYGLRHYWKAHAALGFSDEAIEVHLQHGPRVPNLESGLFVFPTNGACHRFGADETAFANRHTVMSAVISGTWHDAADDAANVSWVRDYFDALKPWSELGGYVNFMSDDDHEIVDATYGPKLARLKELKQAYDPDNLFRLNQNIRP